MMNSPQLENSQHDNLLPVDVWFFCTSIRSVQQRSYYFYKVDRISTELLICLFFMLFEVVNIFSIIYDRFNSSSRYYPRLFPGFSEEGIC